MKRASIALILLAMSLGLKAQELPETKSIDTVSSKWYHKNAIGINAGVTGFGVEYARNLNVHLNLRGRVNIFNLKDYQYNLTIDDEEVNGTFNVEMLTADLLLEYLPFSKSSFKLVGGLSYLANYNINGLLKYNGTLEYGDMTLDQEQVGDININADWSGVAPYLGLGFGRAVPKNRVGFGIEAGTFYAKSPEASVSGTKMFEPMQEESEEFQENLSDYRWLPNIKLNLTVKF